ncbi:MAG: ribonuclease P protein component [Candidatus Portnoybacteria bacterium]|nr:ribonuclease P protein component [Candidatus Portnoybacteria bacterium]
MLKKEYRLKKKKDFQNVFEKGETIAGRFVFFKKAKNKSDEKRFGFIVSSKVSKKAVVRNKIKRRLRAIVKEEVDNIKSGLDMVIIAKPQVVDKSFNEIKEEVLELFKKADLHK